MNIWYYWVASGTGGGDHLPLIRHGASDPKMWYLSENQEYTTIFKTWLVYNKYQHLYNIDHTINQEYLQLQTVILSNTIKLVLIS